jgi:hypothetical protein
VDAQVEGRPRKRSRTPEKSASEPKNEGDRICTVYHHPLAPGTPPHIHLPPSRSQVDAWSAAALDGAAVMQPESPSFPVFAPGFVGDHMQRMEPTRSLHPPRPSHRRPSSSDPFLVQVSETLHRAPQGYPTPPISPTPSEWFRNRPIGALSRASRFPQDADPFLAQVTETLHHSRRRSPTTYPTPPLSPTPSEWLRNSPVSDRPRVPDPFLVQVSETLHRAPQGYPTPPISPTPSEWFRNRPIGALSRASRFPQDADPFLAQVPSTLHPNRQRSPPTHLDRPPSDWFRNFEVAELPGRGAHPLLGYPPAVYPPRHPEQEHLPQYEELYFEATGEDEGYWPRRTDALRP